MGSYKSTPLCGFAALLHSVPMPLIFKKLNVRLDICLGWTSSMIVTHNVGRVIWTLNSIPGFLSAPGEGIKYKRSRAESGPSLEGLATQQACLGSRFVLNITPCVEDTL